ncbi:hypothetical protein [Mucilaginibacter paludis]|nr:hypothetical protein [Mucilaginibacter paludis]
MEEDYITSETASAFNAGYILQKHEPQLLDKILQSTDKQNEYINALSTGKKQQEREKIVEQQQAIKTRSQQKKQKR